LKIDLKVKTVYCWLAFGKDRDWAIRADLALWSEAVVCSEAISERTNGMMRRTLGSLKLKMGRHVLLSHMTVTKQGDGENDLMSKYNHKFNFIEIY
jgi:hypothetical protein